MDLIPIGEAAARLGLNPSALRYYEERGLVTPATRQGGKRMYGPEQLRRLALIQVLQRLGIGLDVAAAVLDEPSSAWHAVVQDQITALEEMITRARGAQKFLTHALDCPAEHPVRECPVMIDSLDRLADGLPFEQLAAEHL